MTGNLRKMPILEKDRIYSARRPEILKAMKAKYLVAIGKSDEQDLPHEIDDQNSFKIIGAYEKDKTCYYWRDSEMHDLIETVKKPDFDIYLYINCAKWLFMFYLGDTLTVGNDVCDYLIFFARDFNETTKNLVNVKPNGKRNIVPKIPVDIINKRINSPTKYLKEIQNLIDKLCDKFDENLFIKLNVNVTYILLLMLRRKVVSNKQFRKSFKKDSIHRCYNVLCPHVLDTKLPFPAEFEMSDFSNLTLSLVLVSSLTAKKNLKGVLNATCLVYIKDNGLVLPAMFNQVVELYKVSESDLWDLLCVDRTQYSFSKLYKLYNYQYNNRNVDSFTLFKYCRAIDSNYHSNLSGTSNDFLCTVLAYLIDMKLGMDKSTCRKAVWANRCRLLISFGEELAKEVYEKIANDQRSNEVDMPD